MDFISSRIETNTFWSSTFILHLSFLSQLGLILIQWILNDFIPDHTPHGVFQKIYINESSTPTDIVVQSMFSSFEKWDAVYFLHIARHGYTYENTVAFFPLFPSLVYWVAVGIRFTTFFSLNNTSCLILGAMLVNVTCFSLASLILYKLALTVSNNKFDFASMTVILFTFNPARIFFIAPYSEALFSLTSFLGILSLYDPWNFKSCIFFALSVATRSNGLLNIGFIIHKYVCYIYVTYLKKKKKPPSIFLLCDLFCLIFALGFISTPFLFYQNSSKSLFCEGPHFRNLNPLIISHGLKYNYVLPGTSQASYCKNYQFPYSYVQNHYWNVGFLRYFQFKQIPNFLLASPILLLIFHASYHYFIKCNKVELVMNGQLFKTNHYNKKHFTDNLLFSYYLHASCLSLFCFFCVHVQISTRMLLSSTPLVYFIVSKYVTESHYLSKYCLIYFFSYCLAGVLLFTNYYPWT